MAIVKMKKLRVMAMAADQERLLHQLQHLGCVEISQPSEELEDTKWASMIEPKESQQVQIRAEMSEAQSALAAVKEYGPKKKEGLFPPRRQVTEEELLRPDTLRAGRRAAGRIHTWLDTLARMDADESRLGPLAGPEYAHGAAGERPCGLPPLRLPHGGGPGGTADPALRPGAPGGAH